MTPRRTARTRHATPPPHRQRHRAALTPMPPPDAAHTHHAARAAHTHDAACAAHTHDAARAAHTHDAPRPPHPPPCRPCRGYPFRRSPSPRRHAAGVRRSPTTSP